MLTKWRQQSHAILLHAVLHVHTPLGAAPGSSQTYTRCVTFSTIARIASNSDAPGRTTTTGARGEPLEGPNPPRPLPLLLLLFLFSRNAPIGAARSARLSAESKRRTSETETVSTSLRRDASRTGTPETSQLFISAKHANAGRFSETETTPGGPGARANPRESIVCTRGNAPRASASRVMSSSASS